MMVWVEPVTAATNAAATAMRLRCAVAVDMPPPSEGVPTGPQRPPNARPTPPFGRPQRVLQPLRDRVPDPRAARGRRPRRPDSGRRPAAAGAPRSPPRPCRRGAVDRPDRRRALGRQPAEEGDGLPMEPDRAPAEG